MLGKLSKEIWKVFGFLKQLYFFVKKNLFFVDSCSCWTIKYSGREIYIYMKVFKKDIKIQMERSLSPEGDSHCLQRRTKLFRKTISLSRQCMQEKKLRHSVGKAFSIYLIQIKKKTLGSIFIRKHSCRTLNLYFCSLLEGKAFWDPISEKAAVDSRGGVALPHL